MEQSEVPVHPDPAPTSSGRPWGSAALVGLVLALLQIWVVLTPDTVELDQEELYNAAHAWELLQGHFGDLFVLQYRRFCGGCSLDALLGAAVFSMLAPSFFAWKLVPISFTVLLGVVGFVHLHRRVGPWSAWVFAMVLAFPPQAWGLQSLVAWGNHYESGVLISISLLCLPPPTESNHKASFGSGACMAVALWCSFSATFGAFGLFALLVQRRSVSTLLCWVAGLALVVVPWGLQWHSTGSLPFGTIYEAGYSTPDLTRIPDKVFSLLAPQQLAGLFGIRQAWLGLFLAVGWLISLATACRGVRTAPHIVRQAAGLFALWITIYLVVGFRVNVPEWPLVPDGSSLRYAAPVYPLLFVIVAVQGVRAWQTQRPLRAALILLPVFLSGLVGRADLHRHESARTGAFRLGAADYDYFRTQASDVLSAERHSECETNDRWSQGMHAYALGVKQAKDALIDVPREGLPAPVNDLNVPTGFESRAWLEGVGVTAATHFDPSDNGEKEALLRVARWLEHLPERERHIALTAACWERAYAQGAWSRLRAGDMDDTNLQTVLDGIRFVQSDLRSAMLESLGRKWARAVTGLHRPREVLFPSSDRANASDLADFARGFGEGLGEKWGPHPVVARPRGLPTTLQDELAEGYRLGMDRRWLVGWNAPEFAP